MGEYDTAVSVPVAWYTLVDEEGELRYMLLFENQIEGIAAMMKDKDYWMTQNISGATAISRYFKGMDFVPSVEDLELLMENYKTFEEPPARHILENRKSIDPFYVAQKADEAQEDIFTYAARMYDENEIVRDLYPDKDTYILEVCKAKVYKGKKTPIGIKVEELPIERIPFDATPCYDLNTLVQDVKDKMFHGIFDGIDSVEWTNRPVKQYYGKHTLTASGEHHIVINSLLNSSSVPKEVVMFVIYHELLHRDNMSHDAAFKYEEHKYPKYEECEYFLDGHMNDFEIQEM